MIISYINFFINLIINAGLLPLFCNILIIIIVGIFIYALHEIIKNLPYSFIDILLSQLLILTPYVITFFIGENRDLLTILFHLLIINILIWFKHIKDFHLL